MQYGDPRGHAWRTRIALMSLAFVVASTSLAEQPHASPHLLDSATSSGMIVTNRWVLPAAANGLVANWTAPPFPNACGDSLTNVSIQGESIQLTFGDARSVVRLTRASPFDALRTKYFGVELTQGICGQISFAVANTLISRETADPFISVQVLSPIPSPPEETSFAARISRLLLLLQPWLFVLIALSLYVLIPLTLAYAWMRRRQETQKRRYLIIALALGAAWQIALPREISNWSFVVSESGRYHSMALATTSMIAWFHDHDLHPARAWNLTVAIAYLLSIPLVWLTATDLCRRCKTTDLGAAVALAFAAWPRGALLGTTESPHIVAWCVWLWGLFVLPRAPHWLARGALLLTVCFELWLIRADTVTWTFSYVFLLAEIGSLASLLIYVSVPILAGGFAAMMLTSHSPRLPTGFSESIFQPWGASWSGALAVTALVLTGAARGLRSANPLAVRAILALAVIELATAMGWGWVSHSVAFRYVFATAFPLAILAALGWRWLADGARKRPWIAGSAMLFIAVGLIYDCGVALTGAGRLAFQSEYPFFRDHMQHLPAGARVCVIDQFAHRKPDDPNDFDLSVQFTPEDAWYEQLPLQILPVADVSSNDRNECDYWLEPMLCTIPETVLRPNGSEGVRSFQRACRRAIQSCGGVTVARLDVPGRVMWDEFGSPARYPISVRKCGAGSETLRQPASPGSPYPAIGHPMGSAR